MNQKKPPKGFIETEWEDYFEASYVTAGAPEEIVKELRAAFFCGAVALMSLQQKCSAADANSRSPVFGRVMTSVDAELRHFRRTRIAELAARVAQEVISRKRKGP